MLDARMHVAPRIRVSLCQAASSPGNVEANLLCMERHLQECAESSDLVVFPEVINHTGMRNQKAVYLNLKPLCCFFFARSCS